MQLDWQQLFGSTRTFAISFGIASPDDAAEYGFDPCSDQAGFGTFELWAGGHCLTRNVHTFDDRQRAYVLWSILEIAEWLADAWPAMFHELRFPYATDSAADAIDWAIRSLEQVRLGEDVSESRLERRHLWWSRHCLRAIAGVALPNVALRRVWNRSEVSWDNRNYASARPDIVWTEQRGNVLVPIEDAASTIRTALVAASEALLQRGRADPARASKLREHAQSLGGSPSEYSSWFGFDVNFRAFTPSGGVLRMNEVAVAASGNAALLTLTDLRELESAVSQLRGAASTLERAPCRPPQERPWIAGYELASEFRADHGWHDRPSPDLRTFLAEHHVETREFELSAGDIHGLSVRNDAGLAAVWLNSRSVRFELPWARQMLLAHELCHILYDETGEGTLSLLSGPQTEWSIEARANAFAAALLMPPDGVAREIGDGPVSGEAVKRIMRRFGTGAQATTWHLVNLSYLDDATRVDILRRLDDNPH